MPPSSDDHLQRLEEIVAYLDGELSAEESGASSSGWRRTRAYRQQLQSIERAWLALDQLPQEYVDDRFSRTTMEMAVKAAADRSARADDGPAGACSVAGGFRRSWRRAPRRRWGSSSFDWRGKVPIGRCWPICRWSTTSTSTRSSIRRTFLRSLQQELGDDLHELGCKPCQAPERMERLKIVSDADGRDEWLSQLDDEERTNLRAKFNRFRQLPAEEQQRLRKLHGEIAAEPDAEQAANGHARLRRMARRVAAGAAVRAAHDAAPRRASSHRLSAGSTKCATTPLLTLTDEELRRFVRKIREPLEELQRDAMRESVLKSTTVGRTVAARVMLNQIPNVMIHRSLPTAWREPGEFQDAVLRSVARTNARSVQVAGAAAEG